MTISDNDDLTIDTEHCFAVRGYDSGTTGRPSEVVKGQYGQPPPAPMSFNVMQYDNDGMLSPSVTLSWASPHTLATTSPSISGASSSRISTAINSGSTSPIAVAAVPMKLVSRYPDCPKWRLNSTKTANTPAET